jgi:hypothetical protein
MASGTRRASRALEIHTRRGRRKSCSGTRRRPYGGGVCDIGGTERVDRSPTPRSAAAPSGPARSERRSETGSEKRGSPLPSRAVRTSRTQGCPPRPWGRAAYGTECTRARRIGWPGSTRPERTPPAPSEEAERFRWMPAEVGVRGRLPRSGPNFELTRWPRLRWLPPEAAPARARSERASIRSIGWSPCDCHRRALPGRAAAARVVPSPSEARTRRGPRPVRESMWSRATAGWRSRVVARPAPTGTKTEAAPNEVGPPGVEKLSFEGKVGAKSGCRRKGSRSLGRCHQETLSAGTRGRATYAAQDYIVTGPFGG